MDDVNLVDFRTRLAAYEKRHRGVFHRLRPSGASGRSMLARADMIPWFSGLALVALVFLFKAYIIFDLGEDAYRQQLARYTDPGLAQKIGLAVMTPDGFSLQLQAVVRPLFGR